MRSLLPKKRGTEVADGLHYSGAHILQVPHDSVPKSSRIGLAVVIRKIGHNRAIVAAAITAYDPSVDSDGKAANAELRQPKRGWRRFASTLTERHLINLCAIYRNLPPTARPC